MKTAITIVFTILIFAFIAETVITFSPFSINFPKWKTAVGTFIIIVGFYFIYADVYFKGFNSGADKVIEMLQEKIKEDDKEANFTIKTDKHKVTYTCLICGRTMDQKTPHWCKDGFRKRHLDWKENSHDETN
jgi:hypothetical protein